MALLTSQQIANLNVGLLSRSLVLPQTVARVPAPAGGEGDTVTVRVSQPGTGREQVTPGATITYDNINEVGVNVTLAHLYHATRITAEARTFNVVDFGTQISAVQIDAVARRAEDELAAAMNGLAANASFNLTASEADTKAKILKAREALGEANVPAGDRVLAVSPQIATRLLSVDLFVKSNESGGDSALREATLGRIWGFTVVESNALTDGTALAYHRTGFAFANRAPEGVEYATDTAVASLAGISLRHIFQGQPDILSDASVVSTFAGAGVVDANRVYKLDTATA